MKGIKVDSTEDDSRGVILNDIKVNRGLWVIESNLFILNLNLSFVNHNYFKINTMYPPSC